jgi:hypothetical protein
MTISTEGSINTGSAEPLNLPVASDRKPGWASGSGDGALED